jgi:hypothetical protein
MIQRVIVTLSAAVLGLVFLIAVFVFTSFLVAVALTVGLLGYGWLWWRTRGQRRRVIEGEFRVIERK